MEEQWSTCCGAEASYLSEDLCGECGENAVFEDEDNDENYAEGTEDECKSIDKNNDGNRNEDETEDEDEDE